MGKVDFLEASWPTGVRSTLAGWFTDLQGGSPSMTRLGCVDAREHPTYNHRKAAAEMDLLVIAEPTSLHKEGNVLLRAGGAPTTMHICFSPR